MPKLLQKASQGSLAVRLCVRVASLVATTATAVLIVCAPASANSDPHRIFLPATPFDLPASFCGFPVHIAYPVDKEYATVSTEPDGSTVYVITGSLFATVTNLDTGKSVTVNASGPGTDTFSPDGTTVTVAGTGLFLLYATNATQFGFPSSVVVTSGPIHFLGDLTTFTIISMSTPPPHVLVDVCGALSS